MKMRILYLAYLLAGTACVHAAQASDHPPVDAIASSAYDGFSKDIEQLMERFEAPSVSVAIIKDGDIIYAESFGVRTIETNLPATRDTQYPIGSIVKTFTSGLIGTLEAEGLVDLSAHPGSYLDGLTFDSAQLNSDLTVRSLLSQTSGLPKIDGSLAFFPAAEQGDLIPRLAQFGETCRVGDCWSYNNLNFILLDAIAEAVTGQSKSALIQERLLTPSGMTASVSNTASFERSDLAASGYAKVNGTSRLTATEYLYGEQVYATATDMARWLDVWMQGGAGVIPSDYAKAAMSMQAIVDGKPPSSDEPGSYLFGYGYGWQVRSMDGHYQARHGGNENGFSAQVAFIPASRLGVVTLTNQQNSILPYVINNALTRDLLDLPRPAIEDYPVNVSEAAALISRADAQLSMNPDAPSSVVPNEMVGRYSAPGYGVIDITFEDGVLSMLTPAADFVLVHRAGSAFGLARTTPAPMGINMDFFEIHFDANSLTANISDQPVTFTRAHTTDDK